MLLNDTIAAFATSSASGAVAVLRLSGEKSLEILKALTRKETFEPRKATLVNIYDEGEILDKALALYFKAPNSYTGQDIVELSLHASPYIKMRVLKNCFKLGARQARAGEFTMRAYLNGKMDLAQAQGV
ncbi:MAG: tRNA uridine-5-carboxymethylaminomethyl(34) synthesis GTPase MnmE, partial [Campylobacter sp.]|nr:tRNA uridine-5-carboxymethylaminomethyl(34) synthesis GTPase MnmE [Campylobacter sp.]